MRKHYLKCQPQFMPRIASGQKTFEIRKNDRDFQVGDIIYLEEFINENMMKWEYKGRHPKIMVEIVYLSSAYQQEGYVVLGVKLIPEIGVSDDTPPQYTRKESANDTDR